VHNVEGSRGFGDESAAQAYWAAIDMPLAKDLVEEGIAAEKLGMLDRARSCYAEASTSEDADTAAHALTRLADVARGLTEWNEALDAAGRAQRVAREANLPERLQSAIVAEANVLICRGDFAAATAIFEALLSSATDPKLRGIALQNLGSMLAQTGQLETAERAFTESHECFRLAQYRRGEAIALNNRGRVALDRGESTAAERLLEEALAAAREVQDAELVALATLNLAEVLARRGERDQAKDFASSAFGQFGVSGNRWRETECLRLLGTIWESEGSLTDAERCFSRALAIAEEIGAKTEVNVLRGDVSRVRSALSPRVETR
jgi:tetratricopeptide (TPR) repeat protein